MAQQDSWSATRESRWDVCIRCSVAAVSCPPPELDLPPRAVCERFSLLVVTDKVVGGGGRRGQFRQGGCGWGTPPRLLLSSRLEVAEGRDEAPLLFDTGSQGKPPSLPAHPMAVRVGRAAAAAHSTPPPRRPPDGSTSWLSSLITVRGGGSRRGPPAGWRWQRRATAAAVAAETASASAAGEARRRQGSARERWCMQPVLTGRRRVPLGGL